MLKRNPDIQSQVESSVSSSLLWRSTQETWALSPVYSAQQMEEELARLSQRSLRGSSHPGGSRSCWYWAQGSVIHKDAYLDQRICHASEPHLLVEGLIHSH